MGRYLRSKPLCNLRDRTSLSLNGNFWAKFYNHEQHFDLFVYSARRSGICDHANEADGAI
jgi:hypothetical protein